MKDAAVLHRLNGVRGAHSTLQGSSDFPVLYFLRYHQLNINDHSAKLFSQLRKGLTLHLVRRELAYDGAIVGVGTKLF